jgi:hypothetical protein
MSIRPRQVEMFVASQTAEPLGASDRLLKMILERRRNMFRALNQVRANKGAPGIDKMSVVNGNEKCTTFGKIKVYHRPGLKEGRRSTNRTEEFVYLGYPPSWTG